MNAYRSHGRGTLILKATFGAIKLEVASGTQDPKTLRRLKEMLRTLWEAGRGELIRGVRDRLYTPLELWQHYRTGNWSAMPSPEHVRALKPLLEAWAAKQTNRYTKKASISYVLRILECLGPKPTVADLPSAITAFRGRCEETGKAQYFNHVRGAAQAFIRVTPGLGIHSPLWVAVARIPRLPVTRKVQPNPQRPAGAWMIAELLGGEDGRIWWTLCCTGMGPDEYFGNKWAVEDGRLHIRGTKRAARDRLVPLVVAIEPPTVTRHAWDTRLWRKQLGVTPYDARRSFSIWLAEAGIPDHRHAAYMGHGPKSQTQHYQRVTDQYLDEDEARLKALLGGISSGITPPSHRERGLIPVQSRPPQKEAE